jgi:hypothetical protein
MAAATPTEYRTSLNHIIHVPIMCLTTKVAATRTKPAYAGLKN